MTVATIEEFKKQCNEKELEIVNDFECFMNDHFPKLNQKISFSIPMWFKGKKMNEGYIGISIAKKHFSIHFSNEEFVHKLSEKCVHCKTGKRCIHIFYHDEESYEMVKESIKEFLSEY